MDFQSRNQRIPKSGSSGVSSFIKCTRSNTQLPCGNYESDRKIIAGKGLDSTDLARHCPVSQNLSHACLSKA